MLWQIRASETLVTSPNIRPLTKIKTHEQELLASRSFQTPTAKLFCKTIHTERKPDNHVLITMRHNAQ